MACAILPKIGDQIDAPLIKYVVQSAANPPVGLYGSIIKLALVLARGKPALQVAELLAACQALVVACHLKGLSDDAANEELVTAFQEIDFFVSSQNRNPPDMETIIAFIIKIEGTLVSASHSQSPRVRQQIAVLVGHLFGIHQLDEALRSIKDILMNDRRFSVRHFASNASA